MEFKKQLLSNEELLKLMELYDELPKYQLEYSKLINAYLILERSMHSKVETSEKEVEVKKDTAVKKEITKESNDGQEKRDKVETQKQVDSAKTAAKLSDDVLEEALGFLNDIDIQQDEEENTSNVDLKLDKNKKVARDGHEYYSYTPKPFDGNEKEEVIKMYLDGYSLVEIDAKLNIQAGKAGQTIKTVDWYGDSINNKVGNANAIRKLTGKTKQSPDYILSQGVNDLASEFNVSPEVALHFMNRARKYIDETL